MTADAASKTQRRASHHRWYLYNAQDWGVSLAPVVVEIETGEKFGGDGGPTRDIRRIYIPHAWMLNLREREWEVLEEHIQALSDEEFAELIEDGSVIPIRGDKTP